MLAFVLATVTSCQAEQRLPSATFLEIGGSQVRDNATRPYVVTRDATVAFRYSSGATAEESVIIVNPGGVGGDGRYYPIATDFLGQDCPQGRDVRCGTIKIGASPDESADFTVAIYSVPTQIAGTVREVAAANANQEPDSAWTNLPAELGRPLDLVSVVREN